MTTTSSSEEGNPSSSLSEIFPADDEMKAQSFRKRRLSLTLNNCDNHVPTNNNDACDDILDDGVPCHNDEKNSTPISEFLVEKNEFPRENDDDDDEKAHTFRRRRLSLTTSTSIPTAFSVPASSIVNGSLHISNENGKLRRSSIDSHGSVASSVGSHETGNSFAFVSRTLHAGELVSSNGAPPPSPALGPSSANHILYQPTITPPPVLHLGVSSQSQFSVLNGKSSSPIPKWKRRHTFDDPDGMDHHKLPFSRDVVGTYSCHGVEPVFDIETDMDQLEAHGSQLSDIAAKPTDIHVTVAKINQDRGGVACPYGSDPKTALFAVYDGHGQGGELVSQFALYEIQRRLGKHPTFKTDIERAFKETFLAVDEALTEEPMIDPLFAGTTACVVLVHDRRLTVANAGDSRAVCARRRTSSSIDEENVAASYIALDLSTDQNPDVPSEMERILKAGGFVTLPPGPGLSARVWLDPRCTQIGLAMSRSIGDHAIATVGVIAEPVVTFHDVTTEDEFLIVASDGVWEFLDSDDAVNIVAKNLRRGSTKACQALIEAAAEKWHEEEGAYRDDITAIVVRLQELWKDK
jgi:protein phosphatase PTC2/3